MILFHTKFPVAKHIVKKNNRPIYFNQKTQRVFLGKSNKLYEAEYYLFQQLKSAAAAQNLFNPIDGPVWVTMKFYFENYYTKKGERSKNLPDLSNLYQLVEDALQTTNIILDDNQIMAHDESRRLPGNKNELEITIRQFDEQFK